MLIGPKRSGKGTIARVTAPATCGFCYSWRCFDVVRAQARGIEKSTNAFAGGLYLRHGIKAKQPDASGASSLGSQREPQPPGVTLADSNRFGATPHGAQRTDRVRQAQNKHVNNGRLQASLFPSFRFPIPSKEIPSFVVQGILL